MGQVDKEDPVQRGQDLIMVRDKMHIIRVVAVTETRLLHTLQDNTEVVSMAAAVAVVMTNTAVVAVQIRVMIVKITLPMLVGLVDMVVVVKIIPDTEANRVVIMVHKVTVVELLLEDTVVNREVVVDMPQQEDMVEPRLDGTKNYPRNGYLNSILTKQNIMYCLLSYV